MDHQLAADILEVLSEEELIRVAYRLRKAGKLDSAIVVELESLLRVSNTLKEPSE
jgi:flagellar motor switch protein FliG